MAKSLFARIACARSRLGWLQVDDTRSGVRTAQGCCHVLGNELASYYKTTTRGDRRSVIQALFLGAPVVYRLDQPAFDAMERWGVGQRLRNRLTGMAEGAPSSEAAFEKWLDLRFAALNQRKREQILTAAALSGYRSQSKIPIAERLLSDDAPLFHGLVEEQALSWIHDFRHYLKLQPKIGYQEQARRSYSRRYWKLYGETSRNFGRFFPKLMAAP